MYHSQILQMRTNMDPLTPATATLLPAISNIAETASTLSESLKKLAPAVQSDAILAESKREKQREIVRWVLSASERLSKMRQEGRLDSAIKEWEEVQKLLDKWQTVKGASEVRKECQDIMSADNEGRL